MKKFFTILMLGFLHFSIYGQDNTAKGSLSTTTLVNVEVMKVIPEKVPNVSLVFRAERLDGEPVWDLKKEDLRVREDSLNCEIISIDPISKNKPINVGMVIDHSGSMGSDSYIYFAFIKGIESLTGITPPGAKGSNNYSAWDLLEIFTGEKDSIIPLEHAKRSAQTFVSSFNPEKDNMSVVAFGSTVDLKLPLNKDTANTNKIIGEIKLDGSTALYDGMMAGMKQLKKADGVKVLVALTDGQENASKSKWQDVVDYSLAENIPIYIIGLGFVSEDTLTQLARATKGQFFYTKKASSLVDIYQQISKQIQSFYAIEYISPKLLTMDKQPEVQLSFDIKSVYLLNDPTDPGVMVYYEKKEFDRKMRFYGKVAVGVFVVGGGIVLIYRRRRKKVSKDNVISK